MVVVLLLVELVVVVVLVQVLVAGWMMLMGVRRSVYVARHFFLIGYLDMHVASFQVRNVPPHGALYKSAIARLFRGCGRGKAIYFEDTRYNFVERLETYCLFCVLSS